MSQVGDTPWVCPSCANHLGGYKDEPGGSKGSVVIGHAECDWAPMMTMDVVRCEDCGVVFAVDPSTVPQD